MTNKKQQTQKLVLGAVLTALVVVLQLLGTFVRFGPFAISLVLIPIVIGAATCGYKIGAWLGFVFGVVVLLSGDATAFFAQCQDEFNTWFANLQTNLDNDAAGFLYNQVTQIQEEVADLKYDSQNLNAKMAEGTYSGTGATLSKDSPKVFRFSNFKPSLMIVSTQDPISGVKMAIIHLTSLDSSGLASASVLGIGQQWNNNDEHFTIMARVNFRKEDQTYIVSLWENDSPSYFNMRGKLYHYVVIGK